MADYLHITVTFLDRSFHGRGDGGAPEWPPSPLRLFQALVAGNAHRMGVDRELDASLAWLESEKAPIIVAPRFREGSAYRLSVPNNAMDLVGKAWIRGDYFGSGDSNPATHRAMKTVRPVHMLDGDTLHYLWSLGASAVIAPELVGALARAARRIVALGWGIDLVVGRAGRISSADIEALPGERWIPRAATDRVGWRVPKPGTIQALQRRHDAFLHRIGRDGLVPVPPLTTFDSVGYRRSTDPLARPFVVFELRHDNGSFCAYSQRKLIHIAGMTRHLAREVMQASPPPDVDDGWVERYVVGHRDRRVFKHRQLSYLPLPSVGHRYSDQAIRRIMIAAPVGDDAWLDHLARRLDGRQLKPKLGNEFGDLDPPTLHRVFRDKVAEHYSRPASTWASVTPIILPGHDDRKPEKTRKLIEAALVQSGIEQLCTFEWSSFARFPKSFSAHKYDKDGRPVGYLRPSHLITNTAMHLVLRFEGGVSVPGPFSIGAGRHCGLGLFAVTHD